MGVVECSKIWRANSRLAYNTTGVFILGAGEGPHGRWIDFLSRIIDKSTSYAITIMEGVLARLDLSSTTQIAVWADAGSHFKSYEMLAFLGLKVVEQARCPVRAYYGLGGHFKISL